MTGAPQTPQTPPSPPVGKTSKASTTVGYLVAVATAGLLLASGVVVAVKHAQPGSQPGRAAPAATASPAEVPWPSGPWPAPSYLPTPSPDVPPASPAKEGKG